MYHEERQMALCMPELFEIRLNHPPTHGSWSRLFDHFGQIDFFKFSIQAFSCSLNLLARSGNRRNGTGMLLWLLCFLTHTIHVWYIYLHLPYKHVGKYTSRMDPMGCDSFLCLCLDGFFFGWRRYYFFPTSHYFCHVFYPDYINISCSHCCFLGARKVEPMQKITNTIRNSEIIPWFSLVNSNEFT